MGYAAPGLLAYHCEVTTSCHFKPLSSRRCVYSSNATPNTYAEPKERKEKMQGVRREHGVAPHTAVIWGMTGKRQESRAVACPKPQEIKPPCKLWGLRGLPSAGGTGRAEGRMGRREGWQEGRKGRREGWAEDSSIHQFTRQRAFHLRQNHHSNLHFDSDEVATV